MCMDASIHVHLTTAVIFFFSLVFVCRHETRGRRQGTIDSQKALCVRTLDSAAPDRRTRKQVDNRNEFCESQRWTIAGNSSRFTSHGAK